MTQFLLHLFVKNHSHTDDPGVRASVGTLAGITGIVCNLLLTALKLAAGLAAGSVSVIADAVNNLMDAASSVVTLLGFRLARRPADAHHPFGHARYEYLSGLSVAVLILLVGLKLAGSSLELMLHPAPIRVTKLTAAVLVLSAGVKLWMARFNASLGTQIHSTALQAAAIDSRSDALATLAVLAGCGIHLCFSWNVDGYVGLAVAAFICYSGWTMLRDTLSPLLGPPSDGELTADITTIVASHPQVLGVHDVMIHDYGPGQQYATLHAELSAEEDPMECHRLIDHMEQELEDRLHVHPVIHFDPVAVSDAERSQLYLRVCAVVQETDPRLSVHDFRLDRDPENDAASQIRFDLSVPFEMGDCCDALKASLHHGLADAGIPYTADIRFDRYP